MRHKFIQIIKIGVVFVIVALSYIKGLQDGKKLSYRNVSDDNSDSQSNNTDTVDSESSDTIMCMDNECDETFESERGMKIHYGQVHDSE